MIKWNGEYTLQGVTEVRGKGRMSFLNLSFHYLNLHVSFPLVKPFCDNIFDIIAFCLGEKQGMLAMMNVATSVYNGVGNSLSISLK